MEKFKSKEIKKQAQKSVKGAGAWTPGLTNTEPSPEGMWPGFGQSEGGDEDTTNREHVLLGAWTPGV